MDNEISAHMTPLERVKAETGNNAKRINAVRKVQRIIEGDAAEARYSLNRFSAIVDYQRALLTTMRNEILSGSRYFGFLEKMNPGRYQQVLQSAGLGGIKRAEQQLALHYINSHWAACLDTFDNVRRGIHFMAIGRDPKIFPGEGSVVDEYARVVYDLCGKMSENIKQDIVSKMETLPITRTGLNMDEAGLSGGTTTWTYVVCENVFQFSILRRIYNKHADRFSGENGILTNHYRKKRDRNCDTR